MNQMRERKKGITNKLFFESSRSLDEEARISPAPVRFVVAPRVSRDASQPIVTFSTLFTLRVTCENL